MAAQQVRQEADDAVACKHQRERLAERIRQARRRSTTPPSREEKDPRIGYFAFEGIYVICDGDGCVIAGSHREMLRILQRIGRPQATIRATTFSEIHGGLRLGEAYCFDEQAYGRFLGPARQAGIPLEEQDFSDPGPTGMHFIRVQLFH